jgi:hypothetical protein
MFIKAVQPYHAFVAVYDDQMPWQEKTRVSKRAQQAAATQQQAEAQTAKQQVAAEYKDAEWIVEGEREARAQLDAEALAAPEVRLRLL